MNSNIQNQQDTGKRNSFLELYRFLFAMWVVWYHGFFLFKNEYFDDGYLAVEFFFLLSGFYYLKTLDKHKQSPFFVGLNKMVWSKIKPLGIAFAVGIVFVVWQRILEGKPVLMGYLWYVPIMLLSFVLIYILHRLMKSKTSFIIVLAAIALGCYLILYIPISEKLGVARGIGAVSLGVLLSYIPKVNLNINKINLNWIIISLVFAVVIFLAYIPKDGWMFEHLLIFIFMPALIYFTSTVHLNCKVLNYLGSLSFPIYAFQCVLRVIRMTCSIPQFWYFIILAGLVTVNQLISLFIRKLRSGYNVAQ